ncbi:MAG: transposase [Sterolibacteriaceae bacterium]|nr:transposase [Sterolibacteriaceae bacterium]
MNQFYDWLGPNKARGIRLAVMDMWKPFRTATNAHAPQAAILFDKFHVMRHLNDALDKVRKAEYARLSGTDRRYIKGQKYVLLSHKGEPLRRWQEVAEDPAGGQQAPEYGLPAQRNPSASSGTIRAKPGRDASSITGRAA